MTEPKRLGGDEQPRVKELRRQIRSVLPDDRSHFGIHAKGAEPGNVLQRLEHFAVEFVCKIDESLTTTIADKW